MTSARPCYKRATLQETRLGSSNRRRPAASLPAALSARQVQLLSANLNLRPRPIRYLRSTHSPCHSRTHAHSRGSLLFSRHRHSASTVYIALCCQMSACSLRSLHRPQQLAQLLSFTARRATERNKVRERGGGRERGREEHPKAAEGSEGHSPLSSGVPISVGRKEPFPELTQR